MGFSNSDQLLTGLSWDFGPAGAAGIAITGGSAMTGPNSSTVNFSIANVGPSGDVSGEWGYGNGGGTGILTNFVTGNTAGATPFGGANLDGPAGLDGPQGGLVADPILVALGGLGAIQDEIITTITLSGAITEAELLADLLVNGSIIEFGSDAAFVRGVVPAPGAVALLGLAGLVGVRRRRS
jgi:MYXO-CTERM domain-containing protein